MWVPVIWLQREAPAVEPLPLELRLCDLFQHV
jgi:hypothetical protein